MFFTQFLKTFFVLQATLLAQDFPITWEVLSSLCNQVLMLRCNDGYVADGDERLCGSDGQTYLNFCFYAQGRCRKPDITMEYFGPCLNSSTVELPDPVSSTSPPRTTTQDIIVQVFCSQATIDTCPITLDPLCGTDGKFYRNECFFAIEKCTQTALQTQELEKCSSEKVDTTPISNIFGK
uniref:Kazal-like domain-containing protein n=2 Tax=Magallana gigas TaxID=29159 RepID=A0A8W8KVE0_MAGGI|nr:tomoregulin-2-like isoform X2 [Crassostrea gigas]|eukprot:XP_011455365.1 PREDICTED: tomoregulin-2-like [Crassostrea gigas]